MSLLILGGTREAKALAQALHGLGIPLIYSIAGLVRQPELDCQVMSGGFTKYGGLSAFVKAHGIIAILDATHPYAARMSDEAVKVAASCHIPCWRYQRTSWQAQPSDDWRMVAHWQDLLEQMRGFDCVLLTLGQLDQAQLAQLAAMPTTQFYCRSAVEPKCEIPANVQWLTAIGPFSQDQESSLFKRLGIEAVVSKNSGGQATEAKLHSARAAQIPVFMLARPEVRPAERCFSEITSCVEFVARQLAKHAK